MKFPKEAYDSSSEQPQESTTLISTFVQELKEQKNSMSGEKYDISSSLVIMQQSPTMNLK
jgi:hypothetical protein